jgi:hypothetical protein
MLPGGLSGLFLSRTAIHNDTTANAITAKMMMKAAITATLYAEMTWLTTMIVANRR